MATITFSEEPTCPLCGAHDAELLTYDVETRTVEATGLYFEPGKGRVVTGRTLTVKHRDGRICTGKPPSGNDLRRRATGSESLPR